jgi:peptidoglycan biosynthesis protein MviN/MurJ (putative lipid II flippase)
MVIAGTYATGLVADSFNYASLVTGNLFVLFGGLNGPVDSCTLKVLEKSPNPDQSLRAILRQTAFLLTPIVMLGYICAPLLVPAIAQNHNS